MRASALLVVERARGRRAGSVVRELRSRPPLTLLPRRAAVPGDGAAVVHMVSSATSPLGGDDTALVVRVGPGARLCLRGTAATVALPGQCAGCSHAAVRIEVADGATVEYLPEPTVVTARADHRAELRVELAPSARATCREVLVLGRSGERPGSLRTTTSLTCHGTPLLRQDLDLTDPRLRVSSAFLADARVLASQAIVWDHDPVRPYSADWCSLTPLARRGAVATALAPDAIAAKRRLDDAIAHHPDAAELQPPQW